MTAAPFEFVNYIEVECVKELNEHGRIKITGVIREEESRKYMELAAKEVWVSVNAISEKEEIRRLFAGILTGLWIKKEGQVSVLTIEVKTGSYLLDIDPHTRSFQEPGFMYEEMINTCMNQTGGTCSMLDQKGKAANQFFLQYRESDWTFLKRLASHAGAVMIPEDSYPEKKFYWGYRLPHAVSDLQSDGYEMEQDYEWYEKKRADGGNVRLADAVSYKAGSREIYHLGECVRFQGMEFVVGKATSRLEGQELYHEYYLITKERGIPMPISHPDRAGISLKAIVTAVEKTLVKVQIEEDENQAGCRSRWLDYATVYSTPDGTGWYCMPEVGDEVRMVLPDGNEDHAYVAGSVHLGAAGGRTNPDHKSWKNKQNKEIMFTPDAIILRNNHGMSMELSDQEGIRLISNKDIVVQSDGDVQIKSKGAGVNMAADGSILMQQGAAMVQIKDEIHIGGGKIYMN